MALFKFQLETIGIRPYQRDDGGFMLDFSQAKELIEAEDEWTEPENWEMV